MRFNAMLYVDDAAVGGVCWDVVVVLMDGSTLFF
jgi:hypothetical protein